MNTKEIEKKGYKAFEEYVKDRYPNAELKAIMNKGKAENKYGCDAIMTLDGEKHFIELKASTNTGLVSNIRFTHQTLATMYNADVLSKMIVVYVYNLGKSGEPQFKFFRFGDFSQKTIVIEPHFIIQLNKSDKNKSKEFGESSPIKNDLEDVLRASLQSHDVSKLFDSKVSEHMKLNKTSTQ